MQESIKIVSSRRYRGYDELRAWFADWLHEYNYERHHLGIDLKSPFEVVANLILD